MLRGQCRRPWGGAWEGEVTDNAGTGAKISAQLSADRAPVYLPSGRLGRRFPDKLTSPPLDRPRRSHQPRAGDRPQAPSEISGLAAEL